MIQYLDVFSDAAVLIVTPVNLPLLNREVDVTRVSVLHVETITQLIAVTHFASFDNIRKRHVLVLFYAISPIIALHKVLVVKLFKISYFFLSIVRRC